MKPITVSTTVAVPVAKVWEYWNDPKHIPGWAFATPEWGTEVIENSVRVGGRFMSRVFAKDGSMSFTFEGTYTRVEPEQCLEYTMTDGRSVSVLFEEGKEGVRITESFEPEHENSEEKQRAGWQAYLDNFTRYVESYPRHA